MAAGVTKLAFVVKAAAFWRKHEIGKRLIGTIDEDKPVVDIKNWRTSTKATVAGIITYAIASLVTHYVPDFPVPVEGIEEIVTAIVAYVTARLSKTPEEPGIL